MGKEKGIVCAQQCSDGFNVKEEEAVEERDAVELVAHGLSHLLFELSCTMATVDTEDNQAVYRC